MNTDNQTKDTLFSQRIELLIGEVGSMVALARIAGVSETTIRNWRSGKSDAMRENLVALMRGTGVELRWLVVGEGPMRPSSEPAPVLVVQETPGIYLSIQPREDHPIRDESKTGDVEKWILNVHCPENFFDGVAGADSVYAVQVAGDSMEPLFSAGDYVLFDRGENQARREGPHVLRVDDAILVRRLQRLPGNRILAAADNSAYEGFEFRLDEIGAGLQILGQVVGVIRKF